jgi:hypothetical protein
LAARSRSPPLSIFAGQTNEILVELICLSGFFIITGHIAITPHAWRANRILSQDSDKISVFLEHIVTSSVLAHVVQIGMLFDEFSGGQYARMLRVLRHGERYIGVDWWLIGFLAGIGDGFSLVAANRLERV